VFVRRNVDASDTCHFRPLKLLQSALALFVTWICADYSDNTFAPDNLAVTANFLDRSRNSHFTLLKLLACLAWKKRHHLARIRVEFNFQTKSRQSVGMIQGVIPQSQS
jgi:hypothetical protein